MPNQDLPAVTPCDCGAECDLADWCEEDEPCWGAVNVVDEWWTEDDYGWMHACEGHKEVRDGGDYIPYKKEQ